MFTTTRELLNHLLSLKLYSGVFVDVVVHQVAKIRRQIGETWRFRGLYTGLGVNMARNIPLLASFFVFVEWSKKIDISPSWRPFLTGRYLILTCNN
jgi:hypothetical protein